MIYLLIAVTVIVSMLGFQSRAFVTRFYFNSLDVQQRGQWYRLVTSGFLHADWSHLLFNMLGLWLFATDIEAGAGWVRTFMIYFGAMTGGSLLSLALYWHREYRALGASGGVYGILLAHIFFFPGQSLYVFPVPVPLPSWLVVIGFILLSIRGIDRQSGNVGHAAHLGGAAAGLLVATLLYPAIVLANPLLYLVVMGLSLGSSIYFGLRKPAPENRVRPAAPEIELPDLSDEESAKDALELLQEKAERVGVDRLTPRERALLERLRD